MSPQIHHHISVIGLVIDKVSVLGAEAMLFRTLARTARQMKLQSLVLAMVVCKADISRLVARQVSASVV
jgi:hypothetical protein